MTPQEINERIAKLCGWKRIETGFGSQWAEIGGKLAPPDYFNSLDACANFEQLLSFDERNTYSFQLNSACGSGCFATPAQRCEAFLRMKGQWE